MAFAGNISRFFGSPEIPLELIETGALATFAKGDVIVREGGSLEGAYCILEGTACACLDRSGDRASIVAYVESGGFVCDADILAGSTEATLTFVAETDCRALFFDREQFAGMVRDPATAPFIASMMAAKVLCTTKMYVDSTRGSALKRVATALLELDAHHRATVAGSPVIKFEVSQQYLASYLNLSRLTVNKCIGRLGAEDLVRRIGGYYSLPNRERLENYLALLE